MAFIFNPNVMFGFGDFAKDSTGANGATPEGRFGYVYNEEACDANTGW